MLWFNGVDEEMMVEYTPELDYNTYYTPNGKEGSKILCDDSTRYSFDTFTVWNGLIDWRIGEMG